MTLGICDHCARVLLVTDDGRVPAHDRAGPVVRRMTGKRRVRCPGSGKAPRHQTRE